MHLINLIKVRKLREIQGLKKVDMSFHLVFTGNPGTGKTTVARLLAKIYKQLGVVSRGQLIEVDRSGLVDHFPGGTAIKTSAVVDRAVGGILFIDEAYTLTNYGDAGDYGQEAVDTLLKRMEDVMTLSLSLQVIQMKWMPSLNLTQVLSHVLINTSVSGIIQVMSLWISSLLCAVRMIMILIQAHI